VRQALLLLAVLLPGPLVAQGLGDAAARERQKRQQQAKPAPTKVFTDADLSSRGTRPPGPAGSAIPAEPSRPGAPEVSLEDTSPGSDPADPLDKERQDRKLLEAEWRVRFANAREQLAIAEAACWQEVVRTQFYQGIPVQMKVKEFVETEELRWAKQALADLEEKFRRTGLPPGWAREK
jgi:hypothetical protein